MANKSSKSSKNTKASKKAQKPRTGFLGQTMPTLGKDTFKSAGGLVGGQQSMNEYTASLNDKLNRANEENAFGSRQYVMGPDGRMTLKDNLSQAQQTINSQREGADWQLGNIANTALFQGMANMQRPYDISGAPAMPGQQGLEQWRDQAEKAEYENYMRRMQPEFQQQQEGLEQQLADRGIPIGSEMYNRELQRLSQQQGDAQLQAQAMARNTFTGQMQAQQTLGQNARTQYVNDYERSRYAPLNEASSALGAQRGVVMPQFQAMSGVNVANNDVSGTGLGWRQQDTQLKMAKMAGSGGGGGGGDPYDGYGDYLAIYGGGQQQPDQTGAIISGVGQGVSQGVINGAINGKAQQRRTGFLS